MRFKLGHIPWNRGLKKWRKKYKFSAEHKRKIGQANKGKKHSIEFGENIRKRQLGKKVSEETKRKMSEIAKKNGFGKWMKGRNLREKSFLWKGGKMENYPENIKIRKSSEYYFWRKSIFERDNFRCQKCRKSGGYLIAHHINNFADFPELRLVMDNGITLCKNCHNDFHKRYGRNNNTKEQLREFLILL